MTIGVMAHQIGTIDLGLITIYMMEEDLLLTAVLIQMIYIYI